MEESASALTATTTERPASPPAKLQRWWLVVATAFGFTLVLYVMRLDRVVGMTIDDAWYVLLAKGLATGQGYSIINSPTPGILPLYPPGFPFILSLLYRLAPRFPENVVLFKWVSVLAMLGTGWLTYVYFTKLRDVSRGYALLLALCVMWCPPLVFLATSTLMSECFFTFLLIATLVSAEWVARNRQLWERSRGKFVAAVVGCAALASYAFLTRTIAVALLAAVFLNFLIAKQLRAAVLFVLVTTVLLSPWLVYSRMHAPTYEQKREQGGQIVMAYSVQFWQRMAAMTTAEIGWEDLPPRVWNNLMEISGRDVLRIIATPLFEKLRDPYQEAKTLLENNAAGKATAEIESPILFSLLLSVFVLLGFIVAVRERLTCVELAVPLLLLLIVLWPWETIRFVLPLTPFLLFYWATGLQKTFLFVRSFATSKWVSAVPLTALAISLLLNFSGHLNYVYKKVSGNVNQWERTFAEVEKMLQWTKQNVPANETVVALNPPLVNLYTGHKTIAWEEPKQKWHLWNAAGIRHFVRFGAYAIPEEPELGNYAVIYRGKEVDMKVIDLGPPDSRSPWGVAPPAR